MDKSLIGVILSNAGVGTAIIVVLILLGILSPKNYTQRVEKEAERWHAAYEASRTENEELRKTVAVHADRAQAATDAAQHSADVLERLVTRSDVAETQARRRGES